MVKDGRPYWLGMGREIPTEGENFYTRAEFTRKTPIITFGVTWNFNNYRPDRRQRDNGTGNRQRRNFAGRLTIFIA